LGVSFVAVEVGVGLDEVVHRVGGLDFEIRVCELIVDAPTVAGSSGDNVEKAALNVLWESDAGKREVRNSIEVGRKVSRHWCL